MTYVVVPWWRVGLAAALVLLSGALSAALRLGLGRQLLIASARTAVQLVLVGMVLQWVFARGHWLAVVGVLVPMTIIAGVSAVQRSPRRFPGDLAIAIGSVWATGWIVSAFGVIAVVSPRPWYSAQYLVPITGLILGNSLTGIALGLDRMTAELVSTRTQVEALLAMGATRWEAARGPLRRAIRAGMTPTVNSMLAAGIVSLPGTLTGQLLSGIAPVEAAKYQIVIMFLIAAGTAFGTCAVVLLGFRRLFDEEHRFLHRRIYSRKTGSTSA